MLPWHYNAQRLSDWVRKSQADPQYLNNGWQKDAAVDTGVRPYGHGVSAIGFD